MIPSRLKVDNTGMILSSVKAGSSIKKRSSTLSYYLIREAITAGVVELQHVDGRENTLDMLTKPLDNNAFMKLLLHVLTGFKT